MWLGSELRVRRGPGLGGIGLAAARPPVPVEPLRLLVALVEVPEGEVMHVVGERPLST